MPRLVRENTLESFQRALELEADGIELDVHATSDGVVVVHHDAWTPDGLEIARVTLADLASGARRRGYEIPTLGDVATLVGERVELFVEIKGDGIEAAVLASLSNHRGRFAFHSFDHAAIARIARGDPSRTLGLLVQERVANVDALLREHGARDLWPHYRLVDRELVEAVHAAGGRVIVWTVNEARDLARLATLGVDGICTDDVRLVAGA
jgi:glycerophosphoryl diester phosphodiesterase